MSSSGMTPLAARVFPARLLLHIPARSDGSELLSRSPAHPGGTIAQLQVGMLGKHCAKPTKDPSWLRTGGYKIRDPCSAWGAGQTENAAGSPGAQAASAPSLSSFSPAPPRFRFRAVKGWGWQRPRPGAEPGETKRDCADRRSVSVVLRRLSRGHAAASCFREAPGPALPALALGSGCSRLPSAISRERCCPQGFPLATGMIRPVGPPAVRWGFVPGGSSSALLPAERRGGG